MKNDKQKANRQKPRARKLRRTHVEDSIRRRIQRALKNMFLKLGYVIFPSSDLHNERVVEYPWVFKRIGTCEGRILDVGCSGSDLSIKLASQGLEVYGIDIYKHQKYAESTFIGHHPNFNFVLCDARWLPFKDSFVDFVTAVSTIEHIGIGCYGDLEDMEGDKNSVKELFRVCKKLGRIFITVPYGKRAITSLQRIYDNQALKRLVQRLNVEVQVEYFTKHDFIWSKSVRAIAEQVDSLPEVRSVACIALTKVAENSEHSNKPENRSLDGASSGGE